jgi:ADP-ribose pyrophosphatase YjhB (NUDIX family)
MGWPDQLVPVGAIDPPLRAAIEAVLSDPFGVRAQLFDSLDEPGHLGATAWVTDPARTRVLLVRHRELGWAAPGGHLEPGEAPSAGARRELAEETGLEAQLLIAEPLFLHRSDVGGRRAHAHWNLAYAFEADPDASIKVERDEVSWFPLDSLPSPAVADLADGLQTVLLLLANSDSR